MSLARLRRRRLSRFARVDSDVGELMVPEGDSVIATTLRRDGVWEPGEGELLRRLVEPDMTVLDIGAHCGYFTLLLSGLVGPGGRVIAVEAAAENFALLQGNLERHGAENVTALNAACWRRSGERLPLSLSADNSGDHRAYEWGSGRPVTTVDSLAIDDLAPRLERLDLVKLDTQATEHVAIEGMEQALRLRPRLLVEFWPTGIRELGDDPLAVAAGYLDRFAVEVIEPVHSGPEPGAEELVWMADEASTEYCNVLLSPRA